MTVGTPMELKDLEYFIAVADAGNFTRAAQSLKLHPSTISRHVGRLEDELGLLLFERNRPGVRLSAGGRAVAQLTRRVLTDLDSIRKIAGLSGIAEFGELRLGLRLPPLGKPLSALLSNWATSHPNIVLKITEMHDRDIVFAIEERRLDVAVVLGHTKWPRAASMPLYRERIWAALPIGHSLVSCDNLDWASIRAESIIVQGWDQSHSQRDFFASFLGSDANFQTHAVSKQTVLALVALGLGLTLVTASQAEVQIPGVAYLPIKEDNAWFQMELVWLSDIEEPVIGIFVAFMRDQSRL